MSKLIITSETKISLTDITSHKLGNLKFDLSQFKFPQKLVFLAHELGKVTEKRKNDYGEMVETGEFSLKFKVYDRALVEVAINNQLTEFGAPITITISNQNKLPSIDKYEVGEFIPIVFENISVIPKRVQKSYSQSTNPYDSWKFEKIQVIATGYKVGPSS